MAKPRLLDVNANNAVFTSILASIHCRRVEIIEDDSVAAQGMDFQVPDDNFAATYDVAAGTEPIVLGSTISHGNAKGPIIGRPAGTSGGSDWAATELIRLRSKTAQATKVRVVEFE